MKYSSSLFVGAYYILACFSMRVNSFLYSFDEVSNKGSWWKIRGDSQYIDAGTTLREHYAEYFPDRFNFGELDSAKGIWVIVPTPSSDCSPFMESGELNSAESSWLGGGLAKFLGGKTGVTNATDDAAEGATIAKSLLAKPTSKAQLCYKNSSATFKFSLKAQLLESATLRYCFGGNAAIRVGGPKGTENYVTMRADGQKLNRWMEETVTLSGNSMNIVASVSGEGDYILIDRINVQSMEATPRPRQPTTTTESGSTSTISPSTTTTTTDSTTTTTSSPEPAPTSGQGRTGFALNSLMLLFAVIVLISFIFNQM